jgi:MFS family permease
MNERRWIYAAAGTRAVTTGFIGVFLGIYLARLGLKAGTIGAVVSAGLVGAALAALAATFLADRLGRRPFLVGTAALMAVGTAAFALTGHPAALMAFAFVGMLNGMGKDRGAALILEQATLPALVKDADRTWAFARYTMLQDVGHAAGALLAGVPSLLAAAAPAASAPVSYRFALLICAALLAATVPMYRRLGSATVLPARDRVRLTPRSRGILARVAALFAVDSIAGGFLASSLLAYFFFERFGAPEAVIAGLFFAARLLNALSHLGAAWLAQRIGLINTMVLTHLPSSLLLVTVAFAPNFPVAAALFLLREGFVEMDVPTRQSYVLAVVAPNERILASGITNLVRLGGWAVAPAVAGALMSGASLHAPLIIGAAMKIAYDLLLWASMRGIKPPEETD